MTTKRPSLFGLCLQPLLLLCLHSFPIDGFRNRDELIPAEIPPTIYTWIEENAHICTLVPTNGDSLTNFLSPEEGPKCALCPEIPSRQLPTSACAVELRLNELDAEIGCHPIPELCLVELRERYADFYDGSGTLPESAVEGTTETPSTSTTETTATVRADVFSSPSGFSALPLNLTMEEIKEHGRTSQPMPQPPDIGQAELLPPPFEPPAGISIVKRPDSNVGTDYEDEKNAPEEKPARPCVDTNDLCCFWATAGECDTNPFWMRVNCPKTCGTCGCRIRNANKCVSTGVVCELTTTTPTTTTIATSTTTETTTTELPSTTRRRPFGGRLGVQPPGHRPQRPLGQSRAPKTKTTTPVATESTSLPSLAISKSPSSTSTEPTTTESEQGQGCLNHHHLCDFWSDSGECERNPFWMRPHCQRACRSCGERLEDVLAPENRPDCFNEHKLCPFWAFIGECARNPRWMMTSCRASCRVC